MESQHQNPEFRNNPENFHPWYYELISHLPKPLLSYIGTFFTFPACILPGAYRVWFRLTFRLKIKVKQSILNNLAIKSQNPVLK